MLALAHNEGRRTFYKYGQFPHHNPKANAFRSLRFPWMATRLLSALLGEKCFWKCFDPCILQCRSQSSNSCSMSLIEPLTSHFWSRQQKSPDLPPILRTSHTSENSSKKQNCRNPSVETWWDLTDSLTWCIYKYLRSKRAHIHVIQCIFSNGVNMAKVSAKRSTGQSHHTSTHQHLSQALCPSESATMQQLLGWNSRSSLHAHATT